MPRIETTAALAMALFTAAGARADGPAHSRVPAMRGGV
jgi:hypothetical protein